MDYVIKILYLCSKKLVGGIYRLLENLRFLFTPFIHGDSNVIQKSNEILDIIEKREI